MVPDEGFKRREDVTTPPVETSGKIVKFGRVERFSTKLSDLFGLIVCYSSGSDVSIPLSSVSPTDLSWSGGSRGGRVK